MIESAKTNASYRHNNTKFVLSKLTIEALKQ